MQLLKELMAIASEHARLDEAASKKLKKSGPFLPMKKIPSFVAGNMVMSDDMDAENDESEAEKPVAEAMLPMTTLKVMMPKARNKQVNDVLKSKKGGRHYDAKKDFVRAKEKSNARKNVYEGDDLPDLDE